MSPRRWALRGARVWAGASLESLEILIQDGRIAAVEAQVDPAAETFDASGLVALPGAIDVHVHFREPGLTYKEDWASGSRAALAGGVTTVLDMPNTNPATATLEALAEKRRLAGAGSLVDFGLFFGLTEQNLDQALLAEGIAGIKIYMGASTGGLLVTHQEPLEAVFHQACCPIVVHAEAEHLIQQHRAALDREPRCFDHGLLRGPDVAAAAVERALELAGRTGAQLHVAHVSTAPELELIAQAKRAGVRVSCEVTQHHLLLDDGFVRRRGCWGKVNPPLRTAQQREAMWTALQAGAVDLIATDHAPHLPAEKELPYERAAAGLPSVDLFLPLLLDCVARGKLSLADVVRLSSEAPARVFGMRSKGRLAPGLDADLVLVDLDAVRTVGPGTLHSKCGWSPYAGQQLQGWPIRTFVRGHQAFGPEGFDSAQSGQEVRFQPHD